MDKFIEFLSSNYWQIAGGIISACFVAWLGYRTARRGRHANACAVFRAAIERELGAMLTKFPTSTSEIDGRLKQAFPALESAVREFRHHVPWWSKRGFNRAWLCYHCAYPDHGESGQRYHHYMPFSGTSNVDGKQEEDDNTKTYKENFKHNVGNLLKYARIT